MIEMFDIKTNLPGSLADVIDVKINRSIASRHIGFTDRFW